MRLHVGPLRTRASKRLTDEVAVSGRSRESPKRVVMVSVKELDPQVRWQVMKSFLMPSNEKCVQVVEGRANLKKMSRNYR